MQARVKPNARYSTVSLFSGRVFTKSEYREVPAGYEDEAMKNEWLEILPVVEIAPVVIVPVSVVEIEIPEVAKSEETLPDELADIEIETTTRPHKGRRGRGAK